MDWQLELHILGQVALAGLMGGVIGLEREWKQKPAGLRTQMFVAASAALFVALALRMMHHFDAETVGDYIRTDPIRVIEAIVTGISFIGAGTVIFHREKDRLEGVTTAASILLTAAIGIAVALRAYVLAGGVTLLTALVLFVIGWLEGRMPTRKESDKPDR